MPDVTLHDILTFGGATPVVTLLVQVIKMYIPAKYTPLAALITGALLCILAALALGEQGTAELGRAALTGLLAGGASIGLYAGQKRLPTPAPILTSKPAPDR